MLFFFKWFQRTHLQGILFIFRLISFTWGSFEDIIFLYFLSLVLLKIGTIANYLIPGYNFMNHLYVLSI